MISFIMWRIWAGRLVWFSNGLWAWHVTGLGPFKHISIARHSLSLSLHVSDLQQLLMFGSCQQATASRGKKKSTSLHHWSILTSKLLLLFSPGWVCDGDLNRCFEVVWVWSLTVQIYSAPLCSLCHIGTHKLSLNDLIKGAACRAVLQSCYWVSERFLLCAAV